MLLRCVKECKRAKCGGAHEYGKCGEGTNPKCCNCGGAHSAAYWGCAVMKRETEIHNVKLKDKVSYAEAVKRVDQTGNVGRHLRDLPVVRDREAGSVAVRPTMKEYGWREKMDLVTFVAGVINATAEVKSKTDRIQIITKAAVQHLGMVGLKWEEVRDGLCVIPPSQESVECRVLPI